jgi:hypothetical protein
VGDLADLSIYEAVLPALVLPAAPRAAPHLHFQSSPKISKKKKKKKKKKNKKKSKTKRSASSHPQKIAVLVSLLVKYS